MRDAPGARPGEALRRSSSRRRLRRMSFASLGRSQQVDSRWRSPACQYCIHRKREPFWRKIVPKPLTYIAPFCALAAVGEGYDWARPIGVERDSGPASQAEGILSPSRRAGHSLFALFRGSRTVNGESDRLRRQKSRTPCSQGRERNPAKSGSQSTRSYTLGRAQTRERKKAKRLRPPPAAPPPIVETRRRFLQIRSKR